MIDAYPIPKLNLLNLMPETVVVLLVVVVVVVVVERLHQYCFEPYEVKKNNMIKKQLQ